MKWILIGIFLFYWDSLMYNISKGYERLWIMTQYDYEGLHDDRYWKRLSWKEKIICDKEYVDEVLDLIDRLGELERLVGRPNQKIGKISRFVVKEGGRGGLFRKGVGVDVWNNAHWMRREGIPVLQPVALIEKKRCGFVVYLYEGDVYNKWRGDIPDFEKILHRHRVIHGDLHPRNLVVLEDRRVQFIDLDKAHRYPKYSYVFQGRKNRELRGFNRNVAQ